LSTKKLCTAFLVTLIALGALALADQVVPYGWKVFVLAKIFRIAWATSVSLTLAVSIVVLLPRVSYLGDQEHAAHITAPVQAVTAASAVIAAFIALGYLMPDWNPWSDLIGAAVVATWAILLSSLFWLARASRETDEQGNNENEKSD
jgi:hypothetical protein